MAAAPTGAARLYAERTALLAGDGQCRVLAANVRAGLAAGALQARGAALRAGWTPAALDDFRARADAAGAARPCADPVLRKAAADATSAFRGWARLQKMDFQGASRTWAARRSADLDGWRLSQNLPDGAKFGLASDARGASQLVLAIPDKGGPAPATATLFMRDPKRMARAPLDVPGRRASANSLAAGLAPRAAAAARIASARVMYRPKEGAPRVLFFFPAAVLDEVAALDPRESVEIELGSGDTPRRLLVEVGDLAAAQAFLAARTS